MIDRSHIEKILKLNGLDSSSPDEEIKSVLISARWHENDVETALIVLHENQKNHSKRMNAVHKIFDEDSKLSPDAINSMLGLNIEINTITQAHGNNMRKIYQKQLISIFIVSVVSAVTVLFFLMKYAGITIF